MSCRTVNGTVIKPGTIALLRFDKVPPSRPHHPYTGDHYHYAIANKAPNGKCFWNALKSLVTEKPIAGAINQRVEFLP